VIFVFRKTLVAVSFVLVVGNLFGQETIISGKVVDAGSGDPVPFANVIFKGTAIGATTDFDGNYKIRTSNPTDSIMASYIGYKSRTKAIKKRVTQVINFQLDEETTKLQEVVVKAGENPAFEILRRVVDNKSKNDKRNLRAFEYDTYSKMEIDADNISQKMRERKVMRKIAQVLDSLDRIAGEDGKPILPLFMSETISKNYYRDNPELKTEHIIKSKVNGLGVDDGAMITQLVGSSLQDYNFYMNWLNFGRKQLVSPIADGWRLYYDYDLVDSLTVGGYYCYRLDFFPKDAQALAFTGTMYITKEGYALKQIDATMGSQANINFINKVKIQHDYEKINGVAWLPVKSRVLIDVAPITTNTAGLLAKFYMSHKNFVLNQPQPIKFYDQNIVLNEDAKLEEDDKVWDTLRHEPLSATEKSVYHMIDTIQTIPIVKSYIDIVKLVLNGYYKTGKVFIGPYLGVFSNNTVEGFRVQAGFKTNIKFSRKWVLGAQLAYGFKDQQFKYNAFARYIFDKKRWTTLTFRARRELGRLGLDEDYVSEFPLFVFASRWGNYRAGFYYDEYRMTFERELFKGFTQRVALRHFNFDPVFSFGYLVDPNDINTPIANIFKASEVFLETRYARDQIYLQNDNDRIGLEQKKWPVFTMRYTHGFRDVLGGNFEYDKIRLNVTKRMKMGPLGNGYFNLTGEKVFGTLPYPLLSVHLGNESYIYAPVNFNLVGFGEFASDRYGSLQYRQNLEGFLSNKIPLLQKLKWRFLATANILVGSMSDTNFLFNSAEVLQTQGKLPPVTAKRLDPTKPYMELGYGVENIFKFLRVDFIHRLSYLSDDQGRNFGVFFSVQLQL
jgi:Family of unknown function (DUF5686)/CarboxypepD_reg-like domain